MKAKVLLKYRDKNTNVIQKTGAIIEVSEERFAEINKDKTRLEAFEQEEEKEPESEKEPEGEKAQQDYNEMSDDELKKIAKTLKIAGYTKMDRESLIAAITGAEEE